MATTGDTVPEPKLSTKPAKAKGSGSTKPSQPGREYMGWESAPIVEWKVQKEFEGRKNWQERWGPWMKEYNKWICSDITRAMRKPSLRSLEWLAWQRKFEVPAIGEWNTRKEVVLESKPCPTCRPCPWPITTYGEIGWLGQHKSCQLEIYGNKYMQKPPLPWYMPKISSFLANSQ